jgi:hypothetical protein
MKRMRSEGKLGRECSAHDITFGGGCLNCGWEPSAPGALKNSIGLSRGSSKYGSRENARQLKPSDIPSDYQVQPLKPGESAGKWTDKATCGTCGLSWDDGKVTGITPAPSGRCPFECFHK